MRESDLKSELVDAFEWVDGRADPSSWWRSPRMFQRLIVALAELHRDESPTVVAGTQSRGMLLGGAVAMASARTGRSTLAKVQLSKDATSFRGLRLTAFLSTTHALGGCRG